MEKVLIDKIAKTLTNFNFSIVLTSINGINIILTMSINRDLLER